MSPQHPIRLIRDGLDWSGRSSCLPYGMVALLWLLCSGLVQLFSPTSIGAAIMFSTVGLISPVYLGHTRRRLRDLGWSGWLTWLAIAPFAAVVLILVLCLRRSADLPGAPVWSRTGFALSVLFGALVMSRVIWEPYWIPAGSMKPTLLIGDYIVTTQAATPSRGDVIVFRHPVGDDHWIKRVIGIAGDNVQMRDGQVVLNGAPLPQEDIGLFRETYDRQGPMQSNPRCSFGPVLLGAVCEKKLLRETLPSGRQYEVLDIGTQYSDNTRIFNVPEGHFFVMGDNRDNSTDSRLPPTVRGVGLVSADQVVGKARWIVFSSSGRTLWNPLHWREDRYFRRIE